MKIGIFVVVIMRSMWSFYTFNTTSYWCWISVLGKCCQKQISLFVVKGLEENEFS